MDEMVKGKTELIHMIGGVNIPTNAVFASSRETKFVPHFSLLVSSHHTQWWTEMNMKKKIENGKKKLKNLMKIGYKWMTLAVTPGL